MYVGEFYCPDCGTTFDLRPSADEECPSCGCLHVLAADDMPVDGNDE